MRRAHEPLVLGALTWSLSPFPAPRTPAGLLLLTHAAFLACLVSKSCAWNVRVPYASQVFPFSVGFFWMFIPVLIIFIHHLFLIQLTLKKALFILVHREVEKIVKRIPIYPLPSFPKVPHCILNECFLDACVCWACPLHDLCSSEFHIAFPS